KTTEIQLSFQTNYLFMKKCVQSNPVVPIQQQWLMSMLTLVPQSLMEGKDRELLIEKLLGEIIRDFEKSMKRCMVRSVLIKPNVKGLEDEEEAPLPLSPLGLDFSSPWHKRFIQAKKRILSNLHILHPTMKTLLDFGYAEFSTFLLADFVSFRLKVPIDCESLKTDISLSCSKAEEKILNTWYQRVISLFTQEAASNGVSLDQLDSFYSCVATLMTNQLRDLLIRNVEAFVQLFDPEDGSCLPLFKMELIIGEKHVEFYPSFQELEEAILFVVNRIGQTLQNVQTVHSWLAGGATTLHTELPTHIVAWAASTLKKVIRDNLEGPKEYFENYVGRYGWLVDGTAQARIERFGAEQHSFGEYTAVSFNSTFYMICREFEAIKERALKVPESTEEMVETIAYIKEVKAKGIQDLSLRIKECSWQMEYFLDVYLFSPEDIALNATVLLWPKKIDPIFDEHDDLIEESKRKGEQELIHRSEKLTVELEKLAQSVTELEEYSELDCMQQVWLIFSVKWVEIFCVLNAQRLWKEFKVILFTDVN
uniref:Dynein axonemal heavy chain 12 n=1 Tax=Pavo cristatus TaxID=9049 RepID=A0A8C9LDZ8_PAVCR